MTVNEETVAATPRIQLTLTPREAGHKLREYAELTANHSKNWEAFEEISASIIAQAYAAGKQAAYDEEAELAEDAKIMHG